MYTPRTQQKFRSVCNGKDFLLFPGPSKIRNVENYKAYSVRFIFKNSNFSHSPPSPNAVQRLVRLAAAYKTISLFTVYIDMFCTRFGQSDHLAKCQSPGQLIPRSQDRYSDRRVREDLKTRKAIYVWNTNQNYYSSVIAKRIKLLTQIHDLNKGFNVENVNFLGSHFTGFILHFIGFCSNLILPTNWKTQEKSGIHGNKSFLITRYASLLTECSYNSIVPSFGI